MRTVLLRRLMEQIVFPVQELPELPYRPLAQVLRADQHLGVRVSTLFGLVSSRCDSVETFFNEIQAIPVPDFGTLLPCFKPASFLHEFGSGHVAFAILWYSITDWESQLRTMKEILRHLLEAEETGCRAAAELEARGEELLRRATTESDSIVRKVRADTERQSELLQRQSRTQAQQGCQAIVQETDATIERVRAEATDRRPQAVEQIVAMLLGEPLVTDAGS